MSKPRGYKVQKNFDCCATCTFCVAWDIGDKDEQSKKVRKYIPITLWSCEVMGEPGDGYLTESCVDPLGICDAYKRGEYSSFIPSGWKEDE